METSQLTLRFQGFSWFQNKDRIIDDEIQIIGAGGIGSWTALALSRARYDLYIIDFDKYEEHNVGGQFVPISHIGLKKVSSLKLLLEDFSNKEPKVSLRKIDINSRIKRFVITAVDNFKTREIVFFNWYDRYMNNRFKNKHKLFIDPRMVGEQFTIWFLTGNTSDAIFDMYKSTLKDDNEDKQENLLCSVQQTTHIGMMLGAKITELINKYVTNAVYNQELVKLPYKIEYNGLTMQETKYYEK